MSKVCLPEGDGNITYTVRTIDNKFVDGLYAFELSLPDVDPLTLLALQTLPDGEGKNPA